MTTIGLDDIGTSTGSVAKLLFRKFGGLEVIEFPTPKFWILPHSTQFSGKGYHRSSKASGREDLEIEEPVACWNFSAFDFHPTLPGMLGPTLIRHQVVQMRQPREKRPLAPCGMMEAFHGKQFPLDGVMGLV